MNEEYVDPSYPGIYTPEDPGHFGFFKNILKKPDTTKVSNITDDEMYSVRILQNASIFFEITNNILVKKYLENRAEVLLKTALSRDGFLIRQAVTQKKEFSDTTKTGSNKGWFKKKQPQPY